MGLDVVVVGAGVAGCVVARRLADRGMGVRLLEAGPSEPSDAISGLDALVAPTAPGWTWSNDGGYLRGRGLGGGSAINGLVMMGGDTDDLRAMGGEDLVVEVLGAVDQLRPQPQPHRRLTTSFRQAVRSAGYPTSPSSATPDQDGLATAALAVADGSRRSVADVFLAEASPLLTLSTGQEVIELLGSARSVTGVRTADGESIKADHVVLCAGALVSPRMLLERRLGNDHVGRGLKDHPSVGLTLRLKEIPRRSETPPVGGAPATSLLRWSSGIEPLDLMTMPIEAVDPHHGLLLLASMRVASEGAVTPDAIAFNRLSDPEDRARLRAAIRGTVELLTDQAFNGVVEKVFIDADGTPLSELGLDDGSFEDDRLDEWTMDAPDGLYHAACSCRYDRAVGTGGQVLDAVGVSVIDASVLPDLPRANPQLAIMGMAGLLAEQLYQAIG